MRIEPTYRVELVGVSHKCQRKIDQLIYQFECRLYNISILDYTTRLHVSATSVTRVARCKYFSNRATHCPFYSAEVTNMRDAPKSTRLLA